MKQLVFAAYAVNFNGYDKMKELLDACSFANMGPELSMYSKKSPYPDFMEELATVKDMFAPYYVTFHGPFTEVEATSPLDSQAHAYMIDTYKQAFEYYKMFNAKGIVMHTNQKIQLSDDNTDLKNNCIFGCIY